MMNYPTPEVYVEIEDEWGNPFYMKEEEIKNHKTIKEVEEYGWFRRDPTDVNPYRSEYYWNNLYDPQLCRDMIFYAKNHSLPREIKSQENAACDRYIIKNLKELKQDSVFAKRHKLPQKVKFLELDGHILFNASTKASFLRKYGYFHCVTFDEIIKDSVFPYYIRVKVDYLFCPYIKIMETPQKAYLVVDEEGLPEDILRRQIKLSTWENPSQKTTTVYGLNVSIEYTRKGRNVISFTTTIESLFSEDNIVIPNNASKIIYRKNKKASCHIYLTAHYTQTNIFHDIIGVIDYEKGIVSIQPVFKEYYIGRCFTTNNPFILMNERVWNEDGGYWQIYNPRNPNKGDLLRTIPITVYIVEEMTPDTHFEFIAPCKGTYNGFNKPENLEWDKVSTLINYKGYPGDISFAGYRRRISIGNIRASVYNIYSGTCGSDQSDTICLQYPDTLMIRYVDPLSPPKGEDYTDYQIEFNNEVEKWSAKVDDHTKITTDCYLITNDIYSDQVKCIHFEDPMDVIKNWYGDVFYSYYLTHRMPKAFLQYIPDPDLTYDYNDYQNSKHYRDIRAYEWDKLMRIYYYHPELFVEYIERRYENAKYQDNETISDQTFYTVYKREDIMDTSFYNKDPNGVVKFKKPQHYIKYSSTNGVDHFVELFIDGKRTMITYQEVYETDLYIFYDIPNTLEEDITITVCRWPKLNKFKTTIRFNGLDEQIPFPGGEDTEWIRHIPISDLMYVDAYDNRYIDPSDIQYEFEVPVDEIENPFKDHNFDPSEIDYSYFLTNDVEYYSTVYNERLLLDKDRAGITLPNYEESSENDDVTNNDAMKSYYTTSKKLMDLDHIMISSDNEANIYRDIIVTNTNNGKTGIIPDLSQKNPKMVGFTRFEEDPDPYRFRAYHNGLLLSKDSYRYEKPEHFQDNAYFYFDDFDEGQIILDYIPYREKLVMEEIVSEEGTTSYTTYYESEFGAVIVIDVDTDWFNGPVCEFQIKVWIDGVRVSPKKIHRTLDLRRFFIETDVLDNKGSGSRITIYIDRLIEDMEGTTDEAKKRAILQTNLLSNYNLTKGVMEKDFYKDEDIAIFYTGPNKDYSLNHFKRKWDLE